MGTIGAILQECCYSVFAQLQAAPIRRFKPHLRSHRPCTWSSEIRSHPSLCLHSPNSVERLDLIQSLQCQNLRHRSSAWKVPLGLYERGVPFSRLSPTHRLARSRRPAVTLRATQSPATSSSGLKTRSQVSLINFSSCNPLWLTILRHNSPFLHTPVPAIPELH